jgi:ELWxxDGT repeat protein
MLQNIVLFEGDDTNGTVSLWATDGTASGTFELSDVASPPPLITGEANYGFAPYVTVSFDLTVFNNQVLFSGRIGPGKIGPYTLWTTDGTAAGTVPIPLTEIAGAKSSGLFSDTVRPGFAVLGPKVLFRGIDTAGTTGLWKTDGTAAGTTEIAGISGTASTGVNPTDMTVVNGAVLFNGADTAGHLGLWTTDGTAGGTQELSIAGAATSGLNPTDITTFNGEALFNGLDANGLFGLWMTNGSAPGTHEVTGIAGAATTGRGLDPTDMTVLGSKVLFSGVDANGLTGLWVIDGTGTHELLAVTGAPAAIDPQGFDPTDLTVFNDEVFFNGYNQFGRRQLWETDGTAAGTHMLTVAGFSPSFGLNPSNMEVYNDQLLFQGTNGTGFGGLWTTDGTGAGTHEITPASGTYKFGFGPTDLTVLTPGSSTPPPPPPPPAANSSILWQNTSGQASIWQMGGNTLVGGGPVSPSPGLNWRAVGTGDFNNDGHPDILWQNANTGQASIWEMNGSSLIGGGPVSPNPGLAWHAVGTGDFNHDGFSDILWQNTNTGQVSIWEMNGNTGNTIEGGGPVSPNPGTNWKAIGTGDFNKDGDSDILWQNTSTGQISVWEMQGNTLIGGGPVTPNPGTAWQAIGTGDFNGDGFSDILLQNKNTGAVSVWEMHGNSLIGGGPVANPGTSWHAIGTGAAGSEILLQNTSGQTSIWEMHGNTIAGGGPVTPIPGPSWHAIGLT